MSVPEYYELVSCWAYCVHIFIVFFFYTVTHQNRAFLRNIIQHLIILYFSPLDVFHFFLSFSFLSVFFFINIHWPLNSCACFPLTHIMPFLALFTISPLVVYACKYFHSFVLLFIIILLFSYFSLRSFFNCYIFLVY